MKMEWNEIWAESNWHCDYTLQEQSLIAIEMFQALTIGSIEILKLNKLVDIENEWFMEV